MDRVIKKLMIGIAGRGNENVRESRIPGLLYAHDLALCGKLRFQKNGIRT